MDKKGGQKKCPQLLDLIPNDREWKTMGEAIGNGLLSSEEKKLELRLAPRGEEYQPMNSLLSLAANFSPCAGTKRGYSTTQGETLQNQTGFLHLQTKAEVGKELAQQQQQQQQQQQKTNGRGEGTQQQSNEKKACCPQTHATENAAVAHNTSQTRAVSTPVVGWPPVRAFRKNFATTSNKPSLESQKGVSELVAKPDNHNSGRGLFVKINLDGVPIGRKVDLKACDNYDKLALAVDDLFRGLLEAQRHPIAVGAQKHVEQRQAITGLVDGTGEYTLVYEDDEGDQMLVGDVPWGMFISTAKRLRVLKTSDLSTLGMANRKRAATRC